MQKTGGANFPVGGLGGGARLNATWPFGVLVVEAGRVRLRIRLFGVFGRVFGARPLEGTPAEVVEVFPCRGRLGTSGVGLRTAGGERYYFWTGAGTEVLDACRREGFAVSAEVQRM
ncbi:hypothetical protein GCM10009759_74350 [Kitasatospora saccharophila]|uniref:Uncharacterized protein n=1 Tax=Kitasatospora saccharophila TaxID=407973 RepID=A0ABN2YBQ9_9ACTN